MKLLFIAVLVISAGAMPGQDRTVLSVCELLERHREFDGKEVAVRGRIAQPNELTNLILDDCPGSLLIDGQRWPWTIRVSATSHVKSLTPHEKILQPQRDEEAVVTFTGRFELAPVEANGRRDPGRLIISVAEDYEVVKAPHRSVCDLLKNRNELNGRLIRVHAWVQFTESGAYLIQPGCPIEIVLKGVRWPNAVWIDFREPTPAEYKPGPGWRERLWAKGKPEQAVIGLLLGYFVLKPEGELGDAESRNGFGEDGMFIANFEPVVANLIDPKWKED
jgi:hypothetical protein